MHPPPQAIFFFFNVFLNKAEKGRLLWKQINMKNNNNKVCITTLFIFQRFYIIKIKILFLQKLVKNYSLAFSNNPFCNRSISSIISNPFKELGDIMT